MRRETAHDLLSNLFKGYAAVSDNTFTKYIERKQEEDEDGTDIKPTALMGLAYRKYKTLKMKGMWNNLSQEQEKILTLKTKSNKLKRFQKETPSAPPGNPRRQPSSKKERPKYSIGKSALF